MATGRVELYVITSVRRRETKYGEVHEFHGIDSAGDIVAVSIFNNEAISRRCVVNTFIILINGSVTTGETERQKTVRLREKSQVFSTSGTFHVNNAAVSEFLTPPTVTIPEILASPKKRRLSVEATVSDLFPVREGESWRRQDVVLKDRTTRETVVIKLWNDDIGRIDDSMRDRQLSLTCLEVDIYQGKRCLIVTPQCVVTVIQENDPQTAPHTFIGLFDENDTTTLLSERGPIFTTATELLLSSLGQTLEQIKRAIPFDVVIVHDADNVISSLTRDNDGL